MVNSGDVKQGSNDTDTTKTNCMRTTRLLVNWVNTVADNFDKPEFDQLRKLYPDGDMFKILIGTYVTSMFQTERMRPVRNAGTARNAGTSSNTETISNAGTEEAMDCPATTGSHEIPQNNGETCLRVEWDTCCIASNMEPSCIDIFPPNTFEYIDHDTKNLYLNLISQSFIPPAISIDGVGLIPCGRDLVLCETSDIHAVEWVPNSKCQRQT